MSEISCSCCGVAKPAGDFYADRRTGRPRRQCKPCHIAAVMRWRRQHPELVRRHSREYDGRRRARRKEVTE